MASRKYNFALFIRVYTLKRRREAVALSSLYLHYDERSAVVTDKIEFSQPAAIPLFKDV